MSIPKIKAVIEFEGKKYRVVGDIASWFQTTNGNLDSIKTDGCIHKVKLIEKKSNTSYKTPW